MGTFSQQKDLSILAECCNNLTSKIEQNLAYDHHEYFPCRCYHTGPSLHGILGIGKWSKKNNVDVIQCCFTRNSRKSTGF